MGKSFSNIQEGFEGWYWLEGIGRINQNFKVVTDVYVSPNFDHSKSFPTLTICLNSMHSDSKVKEFHNQDQQTVWKSHIFKITQFVHNQMPVHLISSPDLPGLIYLWFQCISKHFLSVFTIRAWRTSGVCDRRSVHRALAYDNQVVLNILIITVNSILTMKLNSITYWQHIDYVLSSSIVSGPLSIYLRSSFHHFMSDKKCSNTTGGA